MDLNTLFKQNYFYFFILAFLITIPILPSNIRDTQANDMANHVRHIHEYKLALTEGQFPPLVAPHLNNNLRIPLFQYYTATAYVLPALISFTALNEYQSLKLGIFIFSLLAAIALFKTLIIILQDNRSAFLGALTFQLFAFALIDLYDRGGFVEWIALQYAALVFYSLINLIQHIINQNKYSIFTAFITSILSLFFFIPCHPVQTLYLGFIIACLIFIYIQTRPIKLTQKLLILNWITITFFISLLITSWFWYPILQSFSEIKVTKHTAFFSAGTDAITLFWPWFHAVKNISITWAPQLGIPITLSILFLLSRWLRIDNFAKMLILLFIALVLLIVIPSYTNNKTLSWLFAPIQFSYRLLLPLALLSSLLLAISQKQLNLLVINRKLPSFIIYLPVCMICLNTIPYIFMLSYFNNYSQPLIQILSASYTAPNSTIGYTLAGTNYSDLGWIESNSLKLNTPITLPNEGLPYEARLLLSSKSSKIKVLINNQAIPVKRKFHGAKVELYFQLNPSVGTGGATKVITFQSLKNKILVNDIQFKPKGDSQWIRLPSSYQLKEINKKNHSLKLIVNVTQRGLYQIPICYFPGLRVWVEEQPIFHSSKDKFLIVAPLRKGVNNIYIQNRSLF